MEYKIIITKEYKEWLKKENLRSRVQIGKRLALIKLSGHFGVQKDLGNGIHELKWGGGRRLYYAYIPVNNILLLLGGNKNAQSQDINQAQKILKAYIYEIKE